MRIERDARNPGPLVTAIGPAGFRIGELSYRAALMTPDWVREWTPPPLDALGIGDLTALVAAGPEFVLLGTGATLRRPAPALVRALEAAGIGVEAMDSRAAARAWGVLRGEGRAVAAALYPLN